MNTILTVISIATLLAYVCRVDLLKFRQHSMAAIIPNWIGGAASAWGMVHAGRAAAFGGVNDPLPICWLAVLMSAGWLLATAKDWRHGVPQRFVRQPVVSGPI